MHPSSCTRPKSFLFLLAIFYTVVSLSTAEAAKPSTFASDVREFEYEVKERSANISSPVHSPRLLHHNRKTEYAVVLIHGLFESPRYMQGLANFFYQRDMNVVMPLLAGHWTKTVEEAGYPYYSYWIQNAEESLTWARKFGNKVIFAGYSTGGLLSVYMAVNHPNEVSGLITWAPALGLTKAMYATSYAGAIPGWLDMDANLFRGIGAPDGETIPIFTGSLGIEVVHLINWLLEGSPIQHEIAIPYNLEGNNRLNFLYSQIKAPTMIVTAGEDKVVDLNSVQVLYAAIPGTKIQITYDDLDHGRLPKSPLDESAWRPGKINPHFPEMLKSIGSFLDKNFPASH